MAIEFPSSPQVGDQVTDDTGAVWQWDGVRWIAIGGGGGGGATTLGALNDVTLTSLQPAQMLEWDGSRWVNATPSPPSIDSILSGYAADSGDVLTWDGSSWGPAPAGGSGGSSTLAALDDVALTNQQDGQVLTWDATSGEWINYPPQGIQSLSLRDPLNFALGPPLGPSGISNTIYIKPGTTAGQVLTWNGTAWAAAAAPGGGATTLQALTDVGAMTPTSGQLLGYNGTRWINVAAAPAGTVTSIIAGTGLSGGTITASGTIALANTTVTAGTYQGLTVDAQGRITGATNQNYTTNVGTVTSVAAGTGLTGGTITASGTLALANTTVTPGTFNFATITVDAQGRLTAASTGTPPAGTVTSVATGTGLTGGTITTSGTIALANTGVTPGSYTSTDLTVDAQGRITYAATGSAGGAVTPQYATYYNATYTIDLSQGTDWIVDLQNVFDDPTGQQTGQILIQLANPPANSVATYRVTVLPPYDSAQGMWTSLNNIYWQVANTYGSWNAVNWPTPPTTPYYYGGLQLFEITVNNDPSATNIFASGFWRNGWADSGSGWSWSAPIFLTSGSYLNLADGVSFWSRSSGSSPVISIQNGVIKGITMPIAFAFPGPMTAPRQVNVPITVPITIPNMLVGSQAYTVVRPAASAAFMIYKVTGGADTYVGQITITAAGVVQMYSGSAVNLVVGDVLSVRHTGDTAQADAAMTILATRT